MRNVSRILVNSPDRVLNVSSISNPFISLCCYDVVLLFEFWWISFLISWNWNRKIKLNLFSHQNFCLFEEAFAIIIALLCLHRRRTSFNLHHIEVAPAGGLAVSSAREKFDYQCQKSTLLLLNFCWLFTYFPRSIFSLFSNYSLRLNYYVNQNRIKVATFHSTLLSPERAPRL